MTWIDIVLCSVVGVMLLGMIALTVSLVGIHEKYGMLERRANRHTRDIEQATSENRSRYRLLNDLFLETQRELPAQINECLAQNLTPATPESYDVD